MLLKIITSFFTIEPAQLPITVSTTSFPVQMIIWLIEPSVVPPVSAGVRVMLSAKFFLLLSIPFENVYVIAVLAGVIVANQQLHLAVELVSS